MRSFDPIYFAPQPRLGGGWICFKDSPSAPPTPDYAGAAQATAAGNIDAARVATKANRVNQYTPYGNLIYTQDPNNQDSWSSRIDLSPTGQKLLDYSNNSALGLGGLTGQALNRVDQSLSRPFDINSANDATNKAYQNITSRLDPQWAQAAEQSDSQLANQGITQGSEAYENAKRVFNQSKNDAYTQASTQAMNFAPQTMQLDQAARSQPLNELNALRTGSQVTTPQFGQVPQQGQTAGANYLGAAQSQGQWDQGLYNSQVGQNNATTAGLFSLGSAAMGASKIPWWVAAA